MGTKGVERKIREWCEQYGKDYSQFIVGYGRTSVRSKKRYEFDLDSRIYSLDTTNVKFVVKYFEDDKVYIVWVFKRKKEVYSVDCFKADNAFITNGKVTKNIEYSGWGEEEVLIFDEEKMENFIKNLD